MVASIHSVADMDFQAPSNTRSKFTRITNKLLKPKGESPTSVERPGRELPDPPRFGTSHSGLANRSLRSSNSVSHRSPQYSEASQNYSDAVGVKSSQDATRRASKPSQPSQPNPSAVIKDSLGSEDIPKPVTNPSHRKPIGPVEHLPDPNGEKTGDVTRSHPNRSTEEADPGVKTSSSFPRTATGGLSIVENNILARTETGGTPGLQEQQLLTAEIFRLRGENEALQQERDDARRKHREVDESYIKLEKDLTMRNSEKVQLESAVSQMGKTKEFEFREAQSAFLKEKEEWQRRAQVETQLRRDIGDLQSKLSAANGDLKLLDQFRSGYYSLEKSLELKISELSVRDADLGQLKSLYEDLRIKYGAASDELNKMRLESRAILDDRFFTTKWYALQSDIKHWADNYFWGPKKRNMIVQRPQDNPILHEDLLRLSDDSKSLLLRSEDGSGRSNLAESYLWSFIQDRIFDGNPVGYSKGFFWAHSQRSELCRLEHFLRPGDDCTHAELRMFQKWKASTAKLIISRLRPPAEKGRIPVHPGDLDYLVSHILGILDPWRNGDERDCIRDLRRIIMSAIDIDSHINEQWSLLYALTGPLDKASKERHGFAFDSYVMETPNTDSLMKDNQPVGLVLSPALIRAGTANGDQYDAIRVLAKSRVLPQGVVSSALRSKTAMKNRPGFIKDRNSEP